MSSTLIDRAGLAGDATQALDRQGVDSALITLIGGTSGTAVKLQTCATADGSFTDVVTLADGASDLYAGVAVDLRECERYIKVTGATMAIAVFGDMNYNVKDLTVKTGEIPGGDVSVETNKTVTVSSNGTTEIEPSDTYDAMAKVTLTVAVGLYAFGTAEGAVYLSDIPAADAESVDVYVPSATGIEKTTGSYSTETGVTVSDTVYARYADGDITL